MWKHCSASGKDCHSADCFSGWLWLWELSNEEDCVGSWVTNPNKSNKMNKTNVFLDWTVFIIQFDEQIKSSNSSVWWTFVSFDLFGLFVLVNS